MSLQELNDDADEVIAIVDRAQAEWDAADKEGRIPSPQVRDEVGSIKDYQNQIKALAADLANASPPGPTPPPDPTPPPSWHGPAAGFYPSQRYGSSPRQWGNLTIPTGVPRGVLIQVHGGGWRQGDPNVALAFPSTASDPETKRAVSYASLLNSAGTDPRGYYGLQQMASYAAQRWGVIVWEPAYTYSTGNPDVCLSDVKTSINWLVTKLAGWGGDALPMVYAGHSAGGQLSLRAAFSPEMPVPAAWLGMAAAGLSVHVQADVQDAPGGYAQGGTGWIFNTAWDGVANWPRYAPDTHLADRSQRFPLYIEQGNLNGHDDGSVNTSWARKFAQEAPGSSWTVIYHEQIGADHFSIRWDQSPTTRADMDAIWRAVAG